jgi:hypothetical protein
MNNSNFLGILELLGHYDKIREKHLAEVQRSQLEDETMKGKALYLLWKSQQMFISLCGHKMLKFIVEEHKEAIHYSIIANATPNASHEEQNVLIFRYVSQNKENEQFEIKE